MNTDWKSWSLELPQLFRLLRNVAPADHIAVYSLDALNGLRVVQDYNDDARGLLSRIRSLSQPSLEMLLPQTEPSETTRSFERRDTGLSMPELLGMARIQDLAQALDAIAAHVSELSGQKSLVWLCKRFSRPVRSQSQLYSRGISSENARSGEPPDSGKRGDLSNRCTRINAR